MFRYPKHEGEAAGRAQRVCGGLRLRGPVNHHIVQKSVKLLGSMHGALRVRFVRAPDISETELRHRAELFRQTGWLTRGSFVQELSNASEPEFFEVDISMTGACVAAEVRLETLIDSEIHRPSTVEDGSLFRAVLAKLAFQDYMLILLVDHLVCDGLSMEILRKDFSRLYYEGGNYSVNSLPNESFEFAKWQVKAFESGGFDEAICYWRNQWRRYGQSRIAVPHVPFAIKAGSSLMSSFKAANLTLDRSFSDSLRRCARTNGVTLHTLFLAAFTVALAAVTRKTQLAVWTHFANRTRQSTSDTVGWFSNTHLIGVDLNTTATWSELLRQVRSAMLNSLRYQDVPLQYVWTKLGCQPRFRDIPVLLDFYPSPSPSAGISSRSQREVVIDTTAIPDSSADRFAGLGVYVRETVASLSLTARYVLSTFPTPSIHSLLIDIEAILHDIVAGGDVKMVKLLTSNPAPSIPADHAMGEFIISGGEQMPAMLMGKVGQ